MWSGSAHGLYWMGYGDRNNGQPPPPVSMRQVRRGEVGGIASFPNDFQQAVHARQRLAEEVRA